VTPHHADVSEKPVAWDFKPDARSSKKRRALRHSTTGTVTALRITTDLPRCWTIYMLFCTNSIYSTLGVHRFFSPQNLEATSKFLALEGRKNKFQAQDPQILGLTVTKFTHPGVAARVLCTPAPRNKPLVTQILIHVSGQCHVVFIKA